MSPATGHRAGGLCGRVTLYSRSLTAMPDAFAIAGRAGCSCSQLFDLSGSHDTAKRAPTIACVPPLQKGVTMNFLILANVPSDRAQERTASCRSMGSHGSRFLLFDDPTRLLEVLTVQRMEIVTMLREEGPMTAESIASLQVREKTAVMRDLEALLDLEILDLDSDASYLFGFSGIRVILQFPHRGHKERVS